MASRSQEVEKRAKTKLMEVESGRSSFQIRLPAYQSMRLKSMFYHKKKLKLKKLGLNYFYNKEI